MTEHHEPIIDACLDEVLGGRKPPDLSQRILQALEAESQTIEAPVEDLVTLPAKPTRVSRRGRPSVVSGKPLALRLLIALLPVAVLIGLMVSRTHSPVARSVARPSTDRSSSDRVADESLEPTPRAVGKGRPEVRPPDTIEVTPSFVASGPNTDEPRPNDDGIVTPSTQLGGNTLASTVARKPDDQVIRHVNSRLAENWLVSSTVPAPLVADSQWCERAFQMVIGRDPKPSETAEFLKDRPQRRKQNLLDRLIHSDEYAEDFARRWGEYWTGVFLDDDTLAGASYVARDGLSQYFRRAILDRQPFDEVARGLITATGSSLPGSENYNGAVNFLSARRDEKFTRLTSDVSRLFLGRNIDCQQCHHDPHFDGGKQDEYWQFNAFFRQIAMRSDGSNKQTVTDIDFAGDDGVLHDAKVFYTLPNGLLKVAYPVFRGQAIANSGSVTAVNRRRELAKLITASPDFARNMANRTWETMVGEGFVPSERFARRDELTYPDTLIELADQFAAHGYDLRKLIHWVALSEPFQRETLPAPRYRVASGGPPMFEGFYARPAKPADKLQEVLVASARLLKSPPDSTTTAKVDAISPPGKSKQAQLTTADSLASHVDAASLIEDPMFKAVVGNTKLTDVQKAEHLFQMAMHRQPRARERSIVNEMLRDSGASSEAVLRSIWIALNAAKG